MYKRVVCAASIFSILFCFFLPSYAHSGGTDADGGHYNHSTGEYHYHHGYPAHQHTNGVCPYDFDDNTKQNSRISTRRNTGTKSEKKEVKDNVTEASDIISYCVKTNSTSIFAFLIAVFMARFAKPKEWAWAWIGLGVFAFGAILYNDYTQNTNTESIVFAIAIEIIMLASSIILIQKMYKLREKRKKNEGR